VGGMDALTHLHVGLLCVFLGVLGACGLKRPATEMGVDGGRRVSWLSERAHDRSGLRTGDDLETPVATQGEDRNVDNKGGSSRTLVGLLSPITHSTRKQRSPTAQASARVGWK
jgi:hypothetical protein